MAIKSPKQKGSSWELRVAKMLSAKTEKEFRRVPLSGGWMGGKNRIKNANVNKGAMDTLAGDIMGPDGFPFSIECKNTRDYPRFHLMLSDLGEHQIDHYISQVNADAKHTNKISVLALKKTRVGEFVMIPKILGEKVFGDLEFLKHIAYIYYEEGEDGQVTSEHWILFQFSKFVEMIPEFWDAADNILREKKNEEI